MPFGTVKWFNEKKGYGFIVPEGGGSDVFVHHTGIVGENERVEYNVTQGKKGPMAVDVKRQG
jgi:CspA family cold shock protein